MDLTINFNCVSHEDELAVVKSFFSVFSGSFIELLDRILNNETFGNEYAMCTFPADLDYDEEPYEGIKFLAWENREQIIDEALFRKIIISACKEYVRLYSDTKEEVLEILTKHNFPENILDSN